MQIFSLALLCVLLFSSSVLAQASANPVELVGGGLFVATRAYDGAKTRTMPVPFLVVKHKGFYIKGSEIGQHILDKAPWTISVIATPRFMGYSSEDSAALSVMEDREMSFDAGLRAVYALPWKDFELTAKVLTDTLSRYDGQEYEMAIGRGLKGRIFRLMPVVGVRYQDAKIMNYYYGVKDNEARPGRPAYEPDGTFNPFADLAFSFGVAKRLIVTGVLGVQSLDKDIRKSPIVDKSYTWIAGAGLTYKF